MITSEDIQTTLIPTVTLAGTDTYTGTVPSINITSYFTGLKLLVTIPNANTAVSTINLNTLGAKSIVKNISTPLAAGDITAGVTLLLFYDGTNFVILGSLADTLKVSKSGDSMSGALNQAKGADIASASTTNIASATGNYVHITGTTTITAFGTAQAGTERTLVFDGILTLTYNATSLILPGTDNILTAAGDTAVFRSEGSGNWRCTSYTTADNSYINYSPTYTGFSTPPTVNAGDARYKMLTPKTCHVIIQTGGGTSNTTAMTFTLPFPAKGQQIYAVGMFNNGAHVIGTLRTRDNNTITDAYNGIVGATFTASGSKAVFLSIVYQLF